MEQTEVRNGGSVLFNLHPLPKLKIYMVNQTGLDKNQELLEMLNRRGNSGVSWDPSSQKYLRWQ